MKIEPIAIAGAGWAISFSLRSIAHGLIYGHDIRTIKENIAQANPNRDRVRELSETQGQFDLVGLILKEFIPGLLGLASICCAITTFPQDADVAIASLVFGSAHLIEAYAFHKRYNSL